MAGTSRLADCNYTDCVKDIIKKNSVAPLTLMGPF